jgi:excisionase family DNA binding protein
VTRVPLENRTKFTTGQVARLIEASRSTVIRYIQEGTLRARRTVGGWFVVSREELLNLLWDLSFSKDTPPRIWKASTLAYERMSPKTAPAAPPARARRRRR